jgi:carbohydrate-binding DOMON domain-containing protein
MTRLVTARWQNVLALILGSGHIAPITLEPEKTMKAQLRAVLVTLLLAALSLAAPLALAADDEGAVTIADPTGDDNGPGTYKYPTGAEYKPGAFDITEFKVIPKGDTVEFQVKVASRIEDPWDSKAWGGNGFSVQMAIIHIDTDHKAGSGVLDGIPGTNVRFKPDEAWDRVVIISPQGPGRVNSEIETKAPQWKDRIVVPRLTKAQGKTLIAIVDTKALGGAPKKSWGYNVLMQSNEGFPDKGDLLTRKVNEFEGQHRFGGGSDYNNDPHVIDILAVPPEAQAKILGAYNKDATDPKPEDLAVIPMLYPGSN